MNTYTEKEILEDVDCPDFADDFGMHGGIKYQLTEDEQQWLDFVRGRYCIADYIDNNTKGGRNHGITTFNAAEMSRALDADCAGLGKAVCLSDDTALQKIFFYGYQEETDEN